MSGLEGPYAPPQSDGEAGDEDEDDALQSEAADTVPANWYAIPVWRLFLFSLLGGNIYLLHYMYRSWQAHRRSFGYSAQAVWRARYDATGFQVSPFWRAALLVYSYSWLSVVRREALRERVPGFGPAGPWFALQLTALSFLPMGWNILALSVVFLPAQLTVNRLHDRAHGEKWREPITAGELCWLGLGVVAMLFALKNVGPW